MILLLTGNATTDLLIALAMCIVPFVLGWLAAYNYYKVTYWRTKAATLEEEVGTLNTKVTHLNDDLTDHRVKLTQADADLHDKRMTISKLKNDVVIVETDLFKLRERLAELEGEIKPGQKGAAPRQSGKPEGARALTTSPSEITAPVSGRRQSDEPIAFGGKSYQANDLEIVEGIGPKIAEMLRDAGINTWRQLADASADRLREILDGGGPNFNLHDPATWPEQARMADAGEWDALQKYQTELMAGRAG